MKIGLQRKQFWIKLDAITTKAENSGLKSLEISELRLLPALYRRTISDLSLIRTTDASTEIEVWLNNLVNRAYSLIYSNQPATSKGFLSFLFYEYPLTVYKYRWYLLVGIAIFCIGILAGLLAEILSPALVSLLMGDMVNQYREITSSIPPGADNTALQLATRINPDEMFSSFVMIALNNIKVSFIAFITGVLAGVLTYFVLFSNGFMVGCLTAIYVKSGHSLYFWAGILPHGAWELPLICLSGGAGLIIGLSWIFPKNQIRRVSLAKASIEAWKIIGPIAVWLFITAIIEGFVTPWHPFTQMPRYILMISIGIFNFIVFIAFHWYFGLRAYRAYNTPKLLSPKTKAVPTLQSTNP